MINVTPIKPEGPQPGGADHEQRSKDGVTFQLKDANNRLLAETLEKLDTHNGWHPKTIYAFNRIKARFDSEQDTFRKAFQKLVRKHAQHEPETKPSEADPSIPEPVLDAKGKPVMKPVMIPVGGGMRDFLWKDKKAFNKDYAALGLQEFHVKAYKLTTQELLEGGLNPRELRACVMITEDADPELLEQYQKAATPDLDDDEEDAEEDEAAADSPAPSAPEPAPDGPHDNT